MTLTELIVAVGIAVTVMGLSVGGIMSMVKTSRADGGLVEAVAAFEFARESAVSQRRNVRVTFTAPNQILITRVELNGDTLLLRTVTLEGRVRFLKFDTISTSALPFTVSSDINFGSKTPVMFTSDGSLINSDGDVENGTLMLGVTNDPLTARAITVFGPTGALTPWVWDGRKWNER